MYLKCYGCNPIQCDIKASCNGWLRISERLHKWCLCNSLSWFKLLYVGEHRPSQLTVHQGLNLLLSAGVETNIIINDIPYRYDSKSLNYDIWFANKTFKRHICDYKNNSKLTNLATNSVVHRQHLTRYGLHYNNLGMRVLGSFFINCNTSMSGVVHGQMIPKCATSAEPLF